MYPFRNWKKSKIIVNEKNMSKQSTVPFGLRLLSGILGTLVALVLILGLISAGFLVYWNAPPKSVQENPAVDGGITFEHEGDSVKSVLVEIKEGESSYAVGRRLERSGLIKTRYFWNILSRLDRSYVKSGTYRLNLPASQMDIRSALVEGKQLLLSVTIPEGVTLKKAALILENAGICNSQAFLAATRDRAILDRYKIPGDDMEGYLYPDTYRLPGSFPAERVVRVMADTFFAKVKEISGSASLSPEELNNIVILASIVEREYRVPDEAAVMAGVFYNRIKIGMSLQSCATVEYIITEIQNNPHPHVLYNIDIEMVHPYNTYIIPGLPPGPISLPGFTALNAAFHPSDTDYLYFRLVNEAAGRHYFSRTLDDHIKAGSLFVKGSS
jgi:UPF0755 protein